MIKKVLALTSTLFLIHTTASYSQEMGDYELYMGRAEELSSLYRGAAPLNYNFISTGTYFAYSEEYVKGDVYYNYKLYKDVLLNLNSHLDELYLFVKESGMPVMLNKDFVEKFNIGSRNYVHFKFKERSSSLEDGYYEVLWSNDKDFLIKKRIKNYEVRVNQSVDSETGSKVEKIFSPIDRYYLFNSTLEKQIKRVSHISSFYSIKKVKLRRFIKENNLDFKHDRDNALKSLMSFINSSFMME